MAGCGGGGGGEQLSPGERSRRFAVFRELVLVRRSEVRGGPFFLARFETTRGEWRAWVEGVATAGLLEGGDGDLPVTEVTLGRARAYADWRFCRLPRAEEWLFAATAGFEYRYPWGDLEADVWSNSSTLALGGPTPVGSFESGRRLGGPYDLIGNVAEWTETPSAAWLEDAALVAPRPAVAAPMGAWRLGATPWSLLARLAGDVEPAARLVLGGGYFSVTTPPLMLEGVAARIAVAGRAPREACAATGFRLATDPASVVRRLLREPPSPSAPDGADLAELRRFLTAPDHADLLAEALRALVRRAHLERSSARSAVARTVWDALGG